MLDYEEIENPYEVENLADAISHHIRYMVMIILREHKAMTIGDLMRELERKFGVKMTHGNIRAHLMKMVVYDIVEITKIDGKDAVVLKKDVKIFVKEAKRNER